MTEKLHIDEHFTVPEGYFEHLDSAIMAKLPAQDFQPMKVKKKNHWMPFAIAAASVAIAVSMVSVYLHTADDEPVMAKGKQVNASYTIDEAAELTMIDNQEIYMMVVEE